MAETVKPNQFNQHGSRSKKINPMTGRRFDYETEQLSRHAEENRLAEEQRAIEAELQLLERTKVAKEAADDLLTYARFTMPDPSDPSDPRATAYRAQAFHKEVAKAMEAVERGEIQRLIFCMPPRHGKTELATKRFTAWLSGRHPEWNIAVGTYADSLAEDIGSFLQQHPKIRVSLDERISVDILRSVREGAADLGVLWNLSDLSGLAQAGFTGASVEFTHEVAPGLHGAIVRATKPGTATPSTTASACCSPSEHANCCEPTAKAGCCGAASADEVSPPSACGCR